MPLNCGIEQNIEDKLKLAKASRIFKVGSLLPSAAAVRKLVK